MADGRRVVLERAAGAEREQREPLEWGRIVAGQVREVGRGRDDHGVEARRGEVGPGHHRAFVRGDAQFTGNREGGARMVTGDHGDFDSRRTTLRDGVLRLRGGSRFDLHFDNDDDHGDSFLCPGLGAGGTRRSDPGCADTLRGAEASQPPGRRIVGSLRLIR